MNVLKVMDRLIDWLPDPTHPDNRELPIHREAAEARAAVAELMEAAKGARHMMRANGLGSDGGLYEYNRLDAAIKGAGADKP